MNDNIIKNLLLSLLVVVFFMTAGNAQPWPVPDDYQKMTAPFLFDANAKKAGEAVYMKNCKSCHGDPGKNNIAKITPIPKDPATKEYQNQSDGSMYYKIATGRGPMPAFENILKEDERWQVIAYVRGFNPEYKQPPVQVHAEATKGRNVKVAMNYDSAKKIIICKVRGMNDEKQLINIANVKLSLSAERYFGNLRIGDATTNENGIATIAFPKDLPGDSNGYVHLMVRINDAALGEIEKDTLMKVGMPTISENLLEKRSMWNINSRAPWWVILSYFGVVMLVWGTIFFIIFEIRKIWLYNLKNKVNS